jgi:hypothetical protein
MRMAGRFRLKDFLEALQGRHHQASREALSGAGIGS